MTETVDNTAEPVLEVSGLTVSVGSTAAVKGVSFTIKPGVSIGLIGESGSGKTLTALSVMGLLPDGLSAAGSAVKAGVELLGLDEEALCEIRGDDVSMIFQEPMTALNPVMRIGDQIVESLLIHTQLSKSEAQERAVELLGKVRLTNHQARMRSYPHQLSGGQRQRVVIAIAISCDPDLLIADEPTTALDVTVQAQILDLLVDLVRDGAASLWLITHDLAVVSETCEQVMVMYGGTIVESGPTDEVFGRPAHPYTSGLLGVVPVVGERDVKGKRLPTIRGSVPGLGLFPSGCVFRDRCDSADSECEKTPPRVTIGDRSIACFHPVVQL